MIKFPAESDMVYMNLDMKLSKNNMADVMYAMVMSRAQITNSWCLCYEYTRKQNSCAIANLKVFIHPDNISIFEELSGLKLNKPQGLTLN